jgi:DNA-binding MarR family transcriptional regulator
VVKAPLTERITRIYDVYTSDGLEKVTLIMPESTSVPRPCACTTVRRASRVLAREFDAALEPSGLNVTQLAVLRAIQRHPGEPLMRVAEDLCMDRTSLYRAVTPMQRDGWLTISAGAGARSRPAEFTTRGLRVLEAANPAWGRIQTAIVERFGRDKWAALVAELERLADCARAAGSAETE